MTIEQQDRFYEQLRQFDTAMLVTRADSGALHGRPMQPAMGPDGEFLFATVLESGKVLELIHDARVAILFQGPNAFASISGIARVVRDPGALEQAWTEAWAQWFPGGKRDPRLALIKIEPETGEYWRSKDAEPDRVLFEFPGRGLRPSRPIKRA